MNVVGEGVVGGRVAGGDVAGGDVAGGRVAGGDVVGGHVAGGRVAGGAAETVVTGESHSGVADVQCSKPFALSARNSVHRSFSLL